MTSIREPEVSVVIPTRNRRELLTRALASVRAQVGVGLEVIVVDDGSADDTAELVGRLDDARVRLLRHDNARGVAQARNSGLQAASAPWTAFLDDDDLWAPRRLRAQLDAIAGSDAGWAASGAVVVDEELRLIGAQRPPRPEALPGAILRYNCIPGGASGVLASTEILRRLGGFDPALRILADWDLWTRLALSSPLAVVSHPHVAYVLHGANMTSRPAGLGAELALIESKYAAERSACGVRIDETSWALWFAEVAYRGGARLGPMLTTWRVAVARGAPRLWFRGVAMSLSPGWLERRNAHRLATMDPGWRVEAEGWLADRLDGHSNPPRE